MPPAKRDAYEAQAEACLEAGALHQELLLRVACKLTGSAEEGMNLFQQTLLNGHDAIQSKGFEGQGYQFYILASLKNLGLGSRKQGITFCYAAS